MNLGIFCPQPGDGTSLVRAIMPFGALTREHPALRIIQPRQEANRHTIDWSWMMQCDVIVWQRPFLPEHVNAVATARMLGIPCWIDWDDDLAHVPTSNPSFHLYNNPQIPGDLKRLAEMADVITVSVPELQRRLGHADKTQVIPNAWNDYLFTEHWQPRERKILWRGSASHDEDILSVLPALRSVAHDPRYRLWEWVFLGQPPWYAMDAIPKDRLVQGDFTNPFLYFHTARTLAPTVMIAPIKNTPFNRAKSNLAWIEGTFFGAAVLGPDLEEWQRPGLTNYTDTADFEAKLRGMLDRWEDTEEKQKAESGKQKTESGIRKQKTDVYPEVETSRKFILENLRLSRVNEIRWDILCQLAARTKRNRTEAA